MSLWHSPVDPRDVSVDLLCFPLDDLHQNKLESMEWPTSVMSKRSCVTFLDGIYVAAVRSLW